MCVPSHYRELLVEQPSKEAPSDIQSDSAAAERRKEGRIFLPHRKVAGKKKNLKSRMEVGEEAIFSPPREAAAGQKLLFSVGYRVTAESICVSLEGNNLRRRPEGQE